LVSLISSVEWLLLTEEDDQGGSELETPAPKSDTPASSSLSRDLFLTCGLCELPQSSTGLVAVPDRGYVCGACVDAIRAVTDDEESGQAGRGGPSDGSGFR
jgi:hypothetical protein